MAELFKTAPKEVVDYFDNRGLKPSWRWKDFASHQHALDFTVARTAGFDVLTDIHLSVRKAVVDHIPFEQFQRELIPTLQAKGWWGKRIVRRPSGEKELVQLGSVRRLQTIFWANIASSHAAGEWARTQATKRVLPYLQYKISLSERRRKEHEGWVGITLPVDHPWWRTHYPPNGWHCKCRVEQIGEPRALKAPEAKRAAPPLNVKNWKDKRTGQVWRVPEGIDPGWQRNPGVTREIVAARELKRAMKTAVREGSSIAEKVKATEVLVKASLQTPEFKALAGNVLGKPKKWPSIPSESDLAYQKLRAPVAVLNEVNAKTLDVPAATIVELTGADAPKIADNHNVTLEEFSFVQMILNEPDGTRFSKGKWEYYKAIQGKLWIAVIKKTSEGEVFLNSYHGYVKRNRFEKITGQTIEVTDKDNGDK